MLNFILFSMKRMINKLKTPKLDVYIVRAVLSLPILLLYPVLSLLLLKLLILNSTPSQTITLSNASFVVVAALAGLGFTHASVLSPEKRSEDRERMVLAAEGLAHGAIMLLTVSLLKYALQVAVTEKLINDRPGMTLLNLLLWFTQILYSLSVAFSFFGFKKMNDYYVDKSLESYAKTSNNVKIILQLPRIVIKGVHILREVAELDRYADAATSFVTKSLSKQSIEQTATQALIQEVFEGGNRIELQLRSFKLEQDELATKFESITAMPATDEKSKLLETFQAEVSALVVRSNFITAEIDNLEKKLTSSLSNYYENKSDLELLIVANEIASSISQAATAKLESFKSLIDKF